MACRAIISRSRTPGSSVDDLDGFAIYSTRAIPRRSPRSLGVPEVRFAASLTSGGGGSAGSIGLASAAIVGGMADVCVTLMTLQQVTRRLGGTAVGGERRRRGWRRRR